MQANGPIPSSNQTWLENTLFSSVMFLLKPQFWVDFQLPRLITGGYHQQSLEQFAEGKNPHKQYSDDS